MNKKITVGIVVLVLIAVAFYGGMKYSQHTTMTAQAARFANFGGGRGAGGLRGGPGGGAVVGDIISSDATSVTVGVMGGGSKIVLLSGSTTVMKTVAGSSADLVTGKFITVNGTANADGSVTASSIQIRQATSTGAR